jgi:single-strand DNA-binding protein
MELHIIVGNLGQDPVMRYTPDGTPVVNFSVAVKRTVSKDRSPSCPQGWKESYNGKNWEVTIWWRVSAWRQLAEVCNSYLTKGRQVLVVGEVAGEPNAGVLNPRIWQDRNGVSQASFELTARSVEFLGGNGNGASQETSEEQSGVEDF